MFHVVNPLPTRNIKSYLLCKTKKIYSRLSFAAEVIGAFRVNAYRKHSKFWTERSEQTVQTYIKLLLLVTLPNVSIFRTVG